MDTKQKTKFKGKIIQGLRKLTYTNPDRKAAFDRAKVESATHECELCGVWCYGGSSEKNYEGLKDDYPNKTILKEKAVADHIAPVIPVEGFGGDWDWDVYIKRMHFCGELGWQIICNGCHDEKTREENEERKLHRKKKVDKSK